MAFHVHCVWIAHYNSSYVWSVVCGTRCSRPYWWMSFESPRCPWVCIMAIGFHGAFRSIILVCVPWVLRVHAKYIIIILYTESGLITGHGWWRVKRQSLWCRLLKAPKISLKISGLHFGTSPEMSYCSLEFGAHWGSPAFYSWISNFKLYTIRFIPNTFSAKIIHPLNFLQALVIWSYTFCNCSLGINCCCWEIRNVIRKLDVTNNNCHFKTGAFRRPQINALVQIHLHATIFWTVCHHGNLCVCSW